MSCDTVNWLTRCDCRCSCFCNRHGDGFRNDCSNDRTVFLASNGQSSTIDATAMETSRDWSLLTFVTQNQQYIWSRSETTMEIGSPNVLPCEVCDKARIMDV